MSTPMGFVLHPKLKLHKNSPKQGKISFNKMLFKTVTSFKSSDPVFISCHTPYKEKREKIMIEKIKKLNQTNTQKLPTSIELIKANRDKLKEKEKICREKLFKYVPKLAETENMMIKINAKLQIDNINRRLIMLKSPAKDKKLQKEASLMITINNQRK